MFGTLIEKELKAILLSPKFVAVFSVCSILILLSVYLGIMEYRASMIHYESVEADNAQSMKIVKTWSEMGTSVARRPDPMQIFVSGISNDIGRQSSISSIIKLYSSNYSENTIFAVFRSMDLMFIIQVVLSLFAIMFTYDSISGEKESGTLKLSFANQLQRGKYIIAKIAGSWLGLTIPLLIPLALGIVLVYSFNIPMTGTHWLRLCLLIGISFLYYSFFICLGILLSSVTKESSTSFLYLLVIWIAFVLIIPGAGVMSAGQLVPVPTAAEIASRYSQKGRELDEEYRKWADAHMKESSAALDNLFSNSYDIEEVKIKAKELNDKSLMEINKRGEKLSQDLAAYDALLKEDWRNRKAVQENLGFSLSRISPASAFQLASVNLAETGISLKNTYEDQLRSYRDIFSRFKAQKEQAEKDAYRVRIGLEDGNPIDISEVPQFRYESMDTRQVMRAVIIDVGVLS